MRKTDLFHWNTLFLSEGSAEIVIQKEAETVHNVADGAAEDDDIRLVFQNEWGEAGGEATREVVECAETMEVRDA